MKIRPLPFSGKCGGEDVKGWILHFEGVCIVSGIYADAQQIALLTVCVEGEAARWARAYGRWLQASERTWEEVKNDFVVRFLEEDLEERVNASLKALRQGATEIVKEYLGRFKELVSRSGEATEEGWYQSWVGGLRPELREAVRFVGYRNLDSATRTATRKENASRDVDVLKSAQETVTRSRLNDKLLSALGDWAMQARSAKKWWGSRKNREPSRQENEREARTEERTAVKDLTVRRGRASPSDVRGRGDGERTRPDFWHSRECWHCGERGHGQANCPRLREDAA